LNIFVTSVYGAEKDELCAHFESVFLLNEWSVCGLVIFRGLYADMNWFFCLSVWKFQHS